MTDRTPEDEARELCDELYWDSASTSKSVSDTRLDAYRDAVAARVRAECEAQHIGLMGMVDAAAYARGRADALAEVRDVLESEECAHDLAHKVDDVNPRKTHAGDQNDAAIYCKRIARYALARLTPTEKPDR